MEPNVLSAPRHFTTILEYIIQKTNDIQSNYSIGNSSQRDDDDDEDDDSTAYCKQASNCISRKKIGSGLGVRIQKSHLQKAEKFKRKEENRRDPRSPATEGRRKTQIDGERAGANESSS
jgi:hypothetical protein